MNERKEPIPVTVVGLGAMGMALASAFLAAGHPTTVWNRSAGKADDLVAAGAARAATITEALTASPLVITCLLDYPVLHQVLDPSGGALAGRTLVNLTNGTPEQARETATWAARHDVGYLDGGIMAVPAMIGRPEALVLYSGSQAAFNQHEQTLNRMGGSRYVGADPGSASLYDLALLSAMYGQFAGARHALALVGTENADLPEFTSSLLIPWLTATMIGLPVLAQQDTAQDSDSPSGMQAVAIANIVDASNAQGVDGDLLSHLLIPMRDLIGRRAAGRSLDDLVDLINRPEQGK
ncbi:NAD(P)-dependent oxidoreductase [Amycolatopsis keratiniphila]|uniref:6-phosphogluconate dehydrogenase NAD-binding protein n=1 Tax=Amycolatopsis keratiniphila TaxID=129921 RepID=R4T249_9PSEU|nr:NAD(P)-binding domain-containing protein [Amycolatopsis keratiniphila]AGM04768.1 6-phosphogluconate dehydrogenase NAD-binding protein [Amycolatopsis keratiniphila]